MMARRGITTSMVLEPDLIPKLDGLARAQGLSRSALLNRMIREYIEREGQAIALLSNPALAKVFAQAFGQPGVLDQLAAAIGDKLDSEQLELFHRSLRDSAQIASQAKAPPIAGQVKPPLKGQKGKGRK